MEYRNQDVRRQDRLLDEMRAIEMLRTAEYGVLSMVSDNGGYGVPVNFVWDGNHSVYIHCAPEGRKLHAMELHPDVSLCIVGRVHLLPHQFTTEYESVILFGKAHLHLPEEERMHALRLLIDKLSPQFREIGEQYAHKSFHRTEVVRIDIEKLSGKTKRMHPTT